MLLLTLLSCRPDATNDTGSDPADTSVDLPIAGCDMPAYSWLGTATMGEVIDADQPDGLTVPSTTIDVLLSGFADTEDLAPVPYGVQTHHVRYTTQDRGSAVEATGMVVFPDTDEAQSFPIVLWLHPTMGFSDPCAPTALGLEGAAFAMLFASMGFVVVAPDYLGMAGWGAPSEMDHPYIIAEPTAIASLDMLRAAVSLAASEETLALPDPDRVIYWGASQGGHAALWADRYAPHYTPEFTGIGTISAIPPTDMLALVSLGVQEPTAATVGGAAVLAAMKTWYRSDIPLSDVLVEGMDEAIPALMEQTCDDFSTLGDLDEVTDVYTGEAIEAFAGGAVDGFEPWSCYLSESTLRNTEVPLESDTPTLMILAEEDDLAFAAPARADIEALCGQGYRIEHVECAGASHVSGAVDTLAMQLQWALDRAEGVPWDAAICELQQPMDCAGDEK